MHKDMMSRMDIVAKRMQIEETIAIVILFLWDVFLEPCFNFGIWNDCPRLVNASNELELECLVKFEGSSPTITPPALLAFSLIAKTI